MPLDSACIHRFQILRSIVGALGTRNAQGEYDENSTSVSPVIMGRLMFPPPSRARPEPGGGDDTTTEVVVRYEWLAMPTATDGSPVTVTPSDRLQWLDAGPLGTPIVQVQGQPEHLNNGRDEIGWYGYGLLVEDVDTGA